MSWAIDAKDVERVSLEVTDTPLMYIYFTWYTIR